MTVAAIKEMKRQVKKSIDNADDTTVKMIHAMLEVQQQEHESSAFEDEMERRFKEMEEGKNCIHLTIDQLEERARAYHAERLKNGK